ncbi:hypothetical protein Lsed01_02405 [Demequina sediminis]|uniref:S-layer homology domain-containing protein n=1 Tax=Demequina sediminis TaxID=1930058 RepID=A0ABP9WK22_9MICO|nr:hypothetical protein [Demequina sediminis]BDZ62145.1 hypothetical protein GCM10025873_19360 [Demequina sediminis]
MDSRTVTDPTSVTVFAGAPLASVQDAAPTSVDAQDFAAPGEVTVSGAAQTASGALDASLTVLITESTLVNINPDSTTTASATSTESGYPVDRTRNRVQNDKGWSNWVGSNKPLQDTLTYQYAGMRDLGSVAVSFYADGNMSSWAQTTAIEYRDADGAWQTVPGLGAITLSNSTAGGAPVIGETFEPVRGDALRVVLNAFPNTHMVDSEVEVGALAPSPAAEAGLATLRVDGVEVDGFDRDVTEYEATSVGAQYPTVSAVAVDREARVTVTQPSGDNGGVATVTVRSADGSVTESSTVAITRQVGVEAALPARVTTGTAVTATVETDPADAALAFEWLLDGDVVGKDSTYEAPASAVGAELAVRVAATADGFTAGSITSATATVEPPVSFVDVEGSEHAVAIGWLAAEGISTGWSTPAGQEFRPLADITRDAMAAFLYRFDQLD